MRIRLGALGIAATLALAACGPATPLEPGDETGSDAASGGGATEDDGTPGNSDTGAPGPSGESTNASADSTADSSGGGSSSGTADDTGAIEWPAEGNGQWVCSGFEDPIFLTLEVDADGTANGTACVPGVEISEPPRWMYCGELEPHFNVFGTPIYFAVAIAFRQYPNGQLLVEMGLAYDPETDTLTGPIAANTVLTTETCERWEP